MGTLTFGGMSRKMLIFIRRSKAPTSLMGATKAMCWAPLFFAKTLCISSFQPTTMFHLVVTLCENGGTLDVIVRSKDTFVPLAIPHSVSKANCTKVFKVQLKSWHVDMAKLYDLPTQPAIDRANVIPRVVVVHNEEGMF